MAQARMPHSCLAKEDVFLTVATALAGIGGAFLGLYFTAVSVVASSSYRDVPDDVRVAAINERMGSFYLSMVSRRTAIGIAMSCAPHCDADPAEAVVNCYWIEQRLIAAVGSIIVRLFHQGD